MPISTDLQINAEQSRPRRRTQAERRAATRTALLDATIESLVTYGYAQTTTGRVAELAGVSRGAQAPYFPTRADLVGAAIDHLAQKRTDAIRSRFAARDVTVEEAMDVLWEEHEGALFQATLELWVALRSHPELNAVMRQVEHDFGLAVLQVARDALGELADRPGFAEDLAFAHATIRGFALLRTGGGSSSRAWPPIRARLVHLLDGPAIT